MLHLPEVDLGKSEGRVRVLFCSTVILLCVAPAHAQGEKIGRGPVPAWATPSPLMAIPQNPSGPLFVRRQDLQVHLSEQGQAQHLGYRVKILESSALEIGNIALAWNPAAGSPVAHSIRVYRGADMIDVLKTSSFEILRREDQLEAARLDGILTAVLRIPDLRVGDELEVEVTTFSRDPTLGSKESGIVVLTPSPSPGRYRMGLNWDEGHKPVIKTTSDLNGAAVIGDRSIDFRFDNPAIVTTPKDAPPRYYWKRAVQFSDFADWSALSKHFAPLFAKAATLAPNSTVKIEAARIARAHKSSLDRLGAALKLVQQDVRYIYVGLNGGNLTPATADETWQRRYGDCKGKTALLLALLSEMGINAEAVLISSAGIDDGMDQRLPIVDFFDHVVVRAKIGGVKYWLDGTLPPVATPSPRPVFPVKWVLPLSSRGSMLEQLEWRPATTPEEISMFEIDARAGFDKPARIISTEISRGVKGLQQQIQFSALSSAQLLSAFRQGATGGILQSIDNVEWRYDQAARASILKISGSGTIDWENDGNGERSLALPGGGFNPPERRARAAGEDSALPFYSKPEFTCHVTTVRLPASSQAKHWSSKPSFTTRMFGRTYHRAWEMRGDSIRMIRGSRIEQPEIDAATAQRDNARIAAFDNSMGWITYDPARQKADVGDGERVPATYDFDWTASDVPCAPSARIN